MNQKIILLLFPPILNNFNFHSGEKIKFLIPEEMKKIPFSQDIKSFPEYFSNLDYSEEIKGIIEAEEATKLVLVNYPSNGKQFSCLNEELAKIGKKINNIILLNIANYELITNIRNEYLICPHCQRIYQKNKALTKENFFVCPSASDYQFPREEITKFNDYIIDYYLKNSKELIKKYLEINKLSSVAISQLTIQKKEEIFSGKTQQSLLEIINNIEN